MSKLRLYKRYLYYESVSIPEHTRYDHLSQIKKRALIDNNQFLINNQDSSHFGEINMQKLKELLPERNLSIDKICNYLMFKKEF